MSQVSYSDTILSRFGDTDFRVLAPFLLNESASQQRKILSGFKAQLIDELQKVFPLDKEKVFARNGNQFIRFELTYPTFFERQQALRPHLLLEFTVTSLAVPGINLPVSSLINELTKSTGGFKYLLRISDEKCSGQIKCLGMVGC